MFFDPLWLLFGIPGLLLGLWAQAKTRGTYSKYSEVRNMLGIPGWQVARQILDHNGLHDVVIEESPGELSDHYDPTTRTLRLSPGVARIPSVAAMGIAAHEVGHAIQHARAYAPLRARSALVTPANIGSSIGMYAAMFGFIMQSTGLVWVGVALFSLAVLFSLITLPVEFDASNRAMASLQGLGLVTADEYSGARAVLNAAAWTYVAGFVSAFLQLIYFVFRATGMSRRDE
jgi:Zn-dependent membrane protease YugP